MSAWWGQVEKALWTSFVGVLYFHDAILHIQLIQCNHTPKAHI